MDQALISALIGGLCTAIPAVLTTWMTHSKNAALLNYRMDELERKVEYHNGVVRRMEVVEEQIKVANHRIADLEDECEELAKLGRA